MKKFEKLSKLVKKGDIQKVSEMLQQTTLNINDLDTKSGKTLVQISMENQDMEMFKILSTFPGIDLEMCSKEGESTLETAVILNDVYFTTKLLEHGVNPRKKNGLGETVLEVAVRNQTSKEILKKLVQYKFDLDQEVEGHGSLLNLAIASNQPENVIFLIEHHAKITSIDSEDNTCLMCAVTQNKGDIVLVILQHLSSSDCQLSPLEKQFLINSQNKDGNTAIHIAALKNLQTIFSLLQDRGAVFGIDLALKNKKGQTVEMIKQNLQKERLRQIENEKKRKEQKKLRTKEKEQQKRQQKIQEQQRLTEEKRKRKEHELLMAKQKEYEVQTNKSKSMWVCGIAIVVIISLMYLVILNAVEKKTANTL